MALNRIPCPECGAGLKSASGFAIGQTVCCPKCETYFKVEEPAADYEEVEENEPPKKSKASSGSIKTKAASGKKPIKAATISDDEDEVEDDEDDEPKKKKKKKKRKDDDDDDQERSYKNSPLRYAILGVLVIVMLVGAFFLYKKYQKEHSDETASSKKTDSNSSPPDGPFVPPGGGRPNNGPFIPDGVKKKGPIGGGGGGGAVQPGNLGNALGSGLFGSNKLTAAEKTKLTQKYKSQLIGTWKADLGDGITAQLVYTADGKVTETVSTPKGMETTMGRWTVTDVANQNTLLVMLVWNGMDGKKASLSFEDDELQHPVLGQGVIGIFRKG
jgi:hypothetical protein